MLALPGAIMRSRQVEKAPRPFFQCAHMECTEPAILRRDIKGIELKLCKTHDLFYVQQESDEFCRVEGLDTVEQKRDWMLAKLASPRPTPAEHWAKVLKTPGLIHQAYEMANHFFARHTYSAPEPDSAWSSNSSEPALGEAPDPDEQAAFVAWLNQTAREEPEPPEFAFP